jgi:hypothetical protein
MLNGSVWLLLLATVTVSCRREPPPADKLHAPLRSAAVPTFDPCRDGLRCDGPKRALGCVAGRAKVLDCRGPDGCRETDAAARCDNTLARTGDACDEEHDFACALDRKAALECRSGGFQVVTSYTGIEGCSLKGDEIECAPGKGPACDEIEDIACCLSFARRRVSVKQP